MARMLSNGAIVDDSGQWFWSGSTWKALLTTPTSKQPGAVFGKDRKDVAHLLKGRGLLEMGKVGEAGERVAQLVHSHGSLEAVEEELQSAVTSAAPVSGTAELSSPAGVDVKTYRSQDEYERDARSRIAAGWRVQATTSSHGKVNMGRTIVKAGLFLPWAVMRPSCQGDPLTVTWVREPSVPTSSSATQSNQPTPPAATDLLTQLERLGKLRDSGVLTEDEFQSQKERLLASG